MKCLRGQPTEWLINRGQLHNTMKDALFERRGDVVFIYDDNNNLIRAIVLDEFYNPEKFTSIENETVTSFYQRWANYITSQLGDNHENLKHHVTDQKDKAINS